MLTIDKTLPHPNGAYKLVAGQTPVVTVPLRNTSQTTDVNFALGGVLSNAAAGYSQMLGPAGGKTGAIPPVTTASVPLIGSPVGDQSKVGAPTLDLTLTLTDQTNGVQVIYTLQSAYAVPAPEFPQIPSYCPTNWYEGTYPTETVAVHNAIYLTAHNIDAQAGCPMFVWQLQELQQGGNIPPYEQGTFYVLTIGVTNPQSYFGNVTGEVIAAYVNGQSVPFTPRSVQANHIGGGPIHYPVPLYNPKGLMPL